MKTTLTKSRITKVTKKEVVVCQEKFHQAIGHTKEEALAEASKILFQHHQDTLKHGHRPCDCGKPHVNIGPLHQVDDEFELPHDAWVPSKSTTKVREEMDTNFASLPFAFIGDGERQRKINEILRFSLKQQKEDEISDNTAVVTTLLSRCLTAAGIENRMAYGFRRSLRRDPQCILSDSVKTGTDGRLLYAPHTWLIIDGLIIDNTYIKDFPLRCCKYLMRHTPNCYTETSYENSPCSSSSDEPGPDAELPSMEETARLTGQLMKARIDYCRRCPDMALALSHNREQFYNYFFAMIRFMYEKYEVTVVGIDPRVRFMCWWCEGYPQKGKDLYSDTMALRTKEEQEKTRYVSTLSHKSWRLLNCGRCMVALYCSKNCQRLDWDASHHATCLSRGSVFLPPITNIPH